MYNTQVPMFVILVNNWFVNYLTSYPYFVLDLDDDTLDAQALLFLLAGFETTSTLLSFFFHTMAVNPELQEKLRAHITDITKGQELSYDHLSQLDFLEATVSGRY